MIVSKLKLNMKVSLFLALIIILIPLMGKPVQAAESNWSGAFYNNRSLTGTPTPASYESLYFNWGNSAPAKGVNANNFSAKFQKQITTDGKTGYFLHTYADDGVRLSVDGERKINRWKASSGMMNRALLPNLSAGNHVISSEYFEASGDANYFSTVLSYGNWVAYYYNNADLSGDPIAAESIKPKQSASLSFDHGHGSPASTVNKDNFSAQYISAVKLPEGEYIVRVKGDDGVKVLLDDKEIINEWHPSSYDEKAVKINITDNQNNPNNVHWLKVKYFEKTGESKLDLSIKPVEEAAAKGSWMGLYYNNPYFNGSAEVYGGTNSFHPIRSLNMDWSYGSPTKDIPGNYFSASFFRKIEGNRDYFLQTYADDVIRATVGNEVILNRWDTSWGTTETGVITGLGEGNHLLQVDYLEEVGRAEIMADLAPFGDWIAYYYDNSTLNGKPVYKDVIESDGKSLNFNFKSGSPDSSIPNDNFSAAFTTSKRLDPGKYIIKRDSDDGLRVFVDGKLVVNDWYASSFGESKSNVITINNRENVESSKKNVHTIKVEYLEKSGKSRLAFSMKPIKEASEYDRWLATYYQNQNLAGYGEVTKSKEINFDWGYDSPDNIPNNSFSASFYKLIDGNSDYFIQTYADDNIRATVDGENIINRWNDNSWAEIDHGIVTKSGAGDRLVQVDYDEDTGRAEIVADVVPLGNWLAYHFNNKELEGMPVAKKEYSGQGRNLSIDFGNGSPNQKVRNDHFSSLYTTSQRIEAGPYILRLNVDDGVRIYVDGNLVLDHWETGSINDQITKEIMIKDRKNVPSNQSNIHTIRIEYMEYEGASELDFKLLKPTEDIPSDSWLGLYYPTKNLNGLPVVVGGKYSQEGKLNEVSFNWGTSNPISKIPSDGFSAEFLRNLTGNQEYFVNAHADDGLKVSVNEKVVIDEWHNSSGDNHRALLTGLNPGANTVKVQYYENKGAAVLYSDLVPFGKWSVNYFSNTNFEGNPIAAKILNSENETGFSEKLGYGPPSANVPKNNYSASYVTAKRLEPGEYFISTTADDDIQVLIDGKVVVDSKTAKQENKVKVNIKNSTNGNIHWIEVRHKEYYGESNIEFSMSQFNKNELLTNGDWLAEYYPNIINPSSPKSATGITQITREESLELNWNEGSPHREIPVNEFSAVYQKVEYFSESGQYDFQVSADDGVIVKVDGEIIINSWVTSNSGIRKKENYPISKGSHLIEIIYFEKSGRADIKFSYKASETKEVIEGYKEYSITLDQMVNAQMSVNPQTDKKYEVYIREDALNLTSTTTAVIEGSGWRVRGGPGTNYWIVGTVNSGQKVTIYSKVPAEDGTDYSWYQISYGGGWVDASPADTRYYLNPDNFDDSFQSKLQFLDLSESANVSVDEVNNKILKGKGILEGKAQSFVTAGKVYGVNEVYLIAHALLETGNGYSDLATGIEYNGKTVYNMYGIGAYDNCALECGAKHAYEAGWFTPEEAIIGGADFIGNGYVDRGQDTLYKMRWNPDAVEKYGYPTHQYATDIGWAAKQVYRMNNIYSLLESYSITLEIPRYK